LFLFSGFICSSHTHAHIHTSCRIASVAVPLSAAELADADAGCVIACAIQRVDAKTNQVLRRLPFVFYVMFDFWGFCCAVGIFVASLLVSLLFWSLVLIFPPQSQASHKPIPTLTISLPQIYSLSFSLTLSALSLSLCSLTLAGPVQGLEGTHPALSSRLPRHRERRFLLVGATHIDRSRRSD
jgi:hypothetical protein